MSMNDGNLMKALVAKLYSIITGGDESIKVPRNKFVSWYMPGLTFEPKNFRYCAQGFTGEGADQVQDSYHQAFVVSSLLDYVPDVSSGFVGDQMQQTMFASTGDTISSVYGNVLNYSKVLRRELSEKEKAKLQKFRDLLTVEVTEKNMLTDEVTTVTKPGKLTIAYTQKMNEYITVADQLMNMKIDAMAASGNDPEAKRRVYNWNEKSKFIRNRLTAAEMAWTSQGYRNEYEEINAYIAQVAEKSLVLYKADLQRKLKNSRLTSALDGGSDFYYTTLLPGDFAASSGWTEFTFTTQDYETHSSSSTNKWGANLEGSYGLFSVNASAEGGQTKTKNDQKARDFYAKFSFTQVPIARPWFEPGFFAMRSWTVDENWKFSYGDDPVSGGSDNPVGRLVAYPVTALFVRDVLSSL